MEMNAVEAVKTKEDIQLVGHLLKNMVVICMPIYGRLVLISL